jgi:peroxiredoxin
MPKYTQLPRLQDQLDAITARTRTLVQPDRLAISEGVAADLFATGIEDGILRAGSPAPEFTLQDAQTGKPIHSADLLALGPVIVKFFRGRWDPYCVTELEAWRELNPLVRELGAIFVAISPQTRRQNDFAAQQHELKFPLLSDPGSTVAAQFGIAHTIPDHGRKYFRSILVNIPFANSGLTYETAPDSAWCLPLPGLFLIQPDGKSGTIAFSQAFADPRVRPEPSDLLAMLKPAE